MAAKPIVDGIEREHGERLKVIHLNVQDSVSKPLLERFEFRITPTFIYFDETGEERQRWLGAIDSAQVRQLIEQYSFEGGES